MSRSKQGFPWLCVMLPVLVFSVSNLCAARPPQYSLETFKDEFSDPLDPDTWGTLWPGEPSVSDDELHLNVWRLADGQYTVSQAYTKHFTQRFGYFEANFRITDDQGIGQGFWLGTPSAVVSNMKDRLEIDIQEAYNRYVAPDPHSMLVMAVQDWAPAHVMSSYAHRIESDLSVGFHTYALEWTTDNVLRWYFDDVELRTVTADEMNSYESLLPMTVLFSAFRAPWEELEPQQDHSQMDVDYVRVYQKPGWTGAASGDWTDASKWGTEVVPDVGFTALFNRPAEATQQTTVNLPRDVPVQALYFQTPECPSVTIEGPGRLLLGATNTDNGVGGITVDGSVVRDQIIDADIVAQRSIGIYNFTDPEDGARLEINGEVTSAADQIGLRFLNTGPIYVNGNLSLPEAEINKHGPGTVFLTGENNRSALTVIHEGAIRITGSSPSGALVTGSGRLELEGSITLDKTFRLQGRELENLDPHILNVSGENTLNDHPYFDYSTRIQDIGEGGHYAIRCDAGKLTINGVITSFADDPPGTSYSLHLQGEGNGEIHGDIGNSAGHTVQLIKDGGGTWALSGVNSYSGSTTVNEGTLKLQTMDVLPDTTDVTVNAGATLEVNGKNEAIDALSGSGSVLLGGATLTIGSSDGSGTFSGVISQSGNLVKEGSGTQVLGGANTYGGSTTVRGGTLRLAVAQSLPDGTDVVVDEGATLDFNGNDHAIDALSGSGAVFLGASTLTIGSDDGSGTFSGVVTDSSRGISESGNLVKVGNGTLALTGFTTFTGSTEIKGGSLEGDNMFVGPGGAVTIYENADLVTSGTIVRDVRIYGGLTASGNLQMGRLTDNAGLMVTETLNTGPHLVTLLGADAVELGSATTLDSGGMLFAPNGSALGESKEVTATGRAGIFGAVSNHGTVHGPSNASELLTFHDDVSGPGNYTGNVLFADGFDPGDGAGQVNLEHFSFDRSAVLKVQINGTAPGSAHDQLRVAGGVNLGDATLDVLLGYAPAPGDAFTIIDNQTAAPVVGRFANLADDSRFLVNGYRFGIDYQGGDGNDVALFVPGPEVVGRYVFYNNSYFDGNDAASNSQDDLAIALDKQPLLPGETATFANYTSFSRGINGIMIDVAGLEGTPTTEDFEFKVGNNDDPDTWSDAPAPADITVRLGQGDDDSDRIMISWDDNAIDKEWLQVILRATDETGLLEEDVFYFGNAIGECGGSAIDAKVNAIDMLAARNNQRTFLDPAPVDFAYDFNRDARVNAYDMLIARNNQTHFLNAMRLITVPNKAGSVESVPAAVPEPSAIALLGMGAIGLLLVWVSRRQR